MVISSIDSMGVTQQGGDSFILNSLAKGMALVASKHGLMLVNIDDKDVMTNAILQSGEYCEGELDTLTSLPLGNRIAIEVGADIGAITIPYSRYIGDASRVVTYAAKRDSHYIFCANLALNNIKNVDARFIPGRNTSSMSGKFPHLEIATHYEDWIRRVVEDFDGGDLLASADVNLRKAKKIGLIKINALGYEIGAIKHFTPLIIKYRPFLYFKNENRIISSQLMRMVQDLNYMLFWDLPFYITENNHFNYEIRDEEVRLVAINILAIPCEYREVVNSYNGKLIRADNLDWHPLSECA